MCAVSTRVLLSSSSSSSLLLVFGVDDGFMWIGVGVYVVYGIEVRRYVVSMQVVGSWRGWIWGGWPVAKVFPRVWG